MGAPSGAAGTPALPGPDGVLRCPWAATGPEDYRRYHDAEWGRPVRDERGLYERLSLEGFQAGLSWLTVLRKREALREAFAGFDPEVVARYGEPEVARMLADARLIRSPPKLRAVVAGARAVLALRERLGGLPGLVAEAVAPGPAAAPTTTADVPASTPGSAALARALKAHGAAFVGPVTAYALLQACGFVDDHLAGCAWRGAAGLPAPSV